MHYFDASYLIPLARWEPTSDQVEAFVRSISHTPLATSFWTLVECRSALAREVRMGKMSPLRFESYCRRLNEIIAGSFQLILPTEGDYRLAAAMIEKPETGLRAADAVHLSIAQRLGTTLLLTLDRKMTLIGRAYGIRVGSGFEAE